MQLVGILTWSATFLMLADTGWFLCESAACQRDKSLERLVLFP